MLDIKLIKRSKDKVQQKIAPYRRYFSAMLLLGGFVVDTFTLNRIDQVFDNMVLIVHLLIVSVVLLLLQARSRPGLLKLTSDRARSVLLGLLMFSFGGLFSGFTIFYAKSAGLFSGWAFVVVLLFIMLSAEYYQKAYNRLLVRVGVWVLSVYLYLIFALPVLVGQMGSGVFLVSTLVTVILTWLFIHGLSTVSRAEDVAIARLRHMAGFVIGVILLLYFTNLIPPVPLSLQHQAPYYQVVRAEGDYTVTYQPTTWQKLTGRHHRTLFRQSGEPVFIFTSVFAPVNLQTEIIHQWQYKSDSGWVTTDEIVIPITGGRAEGFRGFSFKQNHQPGSWRVRIATSSGQVVGSLRFTIKHEVAPDNLQEKTL